MNASGFGSMTRKIKVTMGIPEDTEICAVRGRPCRGQQCVRPSPTQPPSKPPNAVATRKRNVRLADCSSLKPAFWKYMVPKPSAFHGTDPKRPCRTITVKVGSLKRLERRLTSERIKPQPLPVLLSAFSIEASFSLVPLAALVPSPEPSRGGSSIEHPTSTASNNEHRPTALKTTRQPCILRMLLVDSGVATRATTAMPACTENWSRPRIRPRRCSAVMSATRPCDTGFKQANSEPLTARSTIMLLKEFTTARRIVTRPQPTQPMVRIVRRVAMPRSAMMPQTGAATD
mmetsp:Transcript_8005/g.17305  ORF Transcript_8005/g.17305 Transcript_8005/m.17305 type:complete len:288 (+) Transcript_8005:614-1477(+)